MIVKKILTIICLCIVFSVSAQILDDSTKQIYGAHSTKYFSEDEISHLTSQRYQIDTTLHNYHQWEYLFDKEGNFYQDLGAIGSASQSIYYQPVKSAGKKLGRDAFSLFAYDNDEVRYFDTKSPHSNFHYQQGSNGQAQLDALFSQSINENINYGFTFKRFSAIDQIGVNTKKNPFTDHYSAQIFTSIQSKNKRYHILANYRYFNHTVFEKGGIYLDSLAAGFDVAPDSLYNEYEFALLDGVKVQDRRNNYHVYQHYQLLDSNQTFYLFHEFDREKQINFYEDRLLQTERNVIGGSSNADFYQQNQVYFSPTETVDSTIYNMYQNKLGLKGKLVGVYYEGFVKLRNYRFKHYFQEFPDYQSELYIGGVLERSVNDKYIVNTALEVSPETGDYLGSVYGKYKDIKVGYTSSLQPSTIFQDGFYSNHIQWQEPNLKRVFSSTIYGEAKWKHKETSFVKGFFDMSFLKNYVYFGSDSLVDQEEKAFQLLNIGFDAQLKWKNLYFREFLKFATSSSEVYNVPTINSISQIYWQKPISLVKNKENSDKKKLLLIQLGADIFYKSSYYANAYLPISQQFYLQNTNHQNSMATQGYATVDLFLNIQLKKIRAFVKIAHVNQGFLDGDFETQGVLPKGYQTTPYFIGKKRTLEFGIGWMFFD